MTVSDVERFAFSSPYVSSLNDLAVAYIEACGFRCVGRADTSTPLDNHEVAAPTPEDVTALACRADCARAEAIVLSCTDMRAASSASGRLPYTDRDRTDAAECKSSDMNADIIADIVSFWLRDSRDSPDRAWFHRGWWYEASPAVDEEIRDRFGNLIPHACARELMDWRSTPDGALALILLLDQFTRNVHRGTVGAYAGDPCAFEVVNHAIDRGLDRALHPVARIWLYHPIHHSEAIAEQDRGLGLLRELRRHADPAWHAYVERSIRGWTRHRNIVARFGRFPHRNAVLGRDSTAEELAYMAAGGRSFGQEPSKGSAAR